MFAKIIDDHMNHSNVVLLQTRICDVYDEYRDEILMKLVKEISKDGTVNHVSKMKFDKLRAAFDKVKQDYLLEKEKNVNLESDKARAVSIIQQLVCKIKHLETVQKNTAQPVSAPSILAPRRVDHTENARTYAHVHVPLHVHDVNINRDDNNDDNDDNDVDEISIAGVNNVGGIDSIDAVDADTIGDDIEEVYSEGESDDEQQLLNRRKMLESRRLSHADTSDMWSVE
jgi:hypothetical protein